MADVDSPLQMLIAPRRFLFFTGKGGVGKTSIACACALALSDRGRRVPLVSTDPASNLDEMLRQPLCNRPVAIPGAPNLQAMNIDPAEAAKDYRDRVIAQMSAGSTAAEQADVREQLSGGPPPSPRRRRSRKTCAARASTLLPG